MVFESLSGLYINDGMCKVTSLGKQVGCNAVIAGGRRCTFLLGDTCNNAAIRCWPGYTACVSGGVSIFVGVIAGDMGGSRWRWRCSPSKRGLNNQLFGQ